MVRSSDVPSKVTSLSAASITGYLSATIPSELLALPTETKDTGSTVQTSTKPAVTSTSDYDFPTMSPPIFNGTTTGIFFTASVANSSLVHPTPFFPNTTSAHYAVPTLNVENRAAEAKGAAGKLSNPLAALIISMTVVALAV